MSKWKDDIPVTLTFTDEQQAMLMKHLFPGDGKEAAAFAICAHRAGDLRHRLIVREVHGIPYEVCTERTPVRVSWPTDYIEPWLEMATDYHYSIIKIHSHPDGTPAFSRIDDEGDQRFLPAVRGWVEADIPHGSVVMLPDGQMFGRTLNSHNTFIPITTISVIGSNLQFWHCQNKHQSVPDFTASHTQAFGAGTTRLMNGLWAAVIGCSGTGSPTIEQLVRLGVSTLVIVDDDYVEYRNLNRILHATRKDVENRCYKAEMLASAINDMGLDIRVIAVTKNLWDPDVIRLVAQCDVLFGCMDTVDGRFLLNTIASCYLLPYFDIGVRLDAISKGKERGHIREICGTVHYLQPGKSSLISRELISMEGVAAAGLSRRDPVAYKQQIKDGYIRGINEQRPAVISVNMFFSSLAINDFLARIHAYREQSNEMIASIEGSLSSLEFFPEPEGEPCKILNGIVGKGDITPLLNLPELSEEDVL